MIRLGHVEITDKSKELVNEVLSSGEIGQSHMITRFENTFAKWLDVKYCVAVCNGTMADTIALAVLKHMNPVKEEVIVPALTFIAQINAIYYNHLRPVFVDIDTDLLMWPEHAAKLINSRTLCVFPVHLLGNPCDMLGYHEMSNALKVPVIEDACEAMGSEFNPALRGFEKCGSFGVMGTFSFFPSHTITTGEGGMIATNNEEYAALARRLINHGKISKFDFHFDMIGFNGKMSSVTAALGLGAMDQIESIIERRKLNYSKLGRNADTIVKKVCPHAFPIIAESEIRRNDLLELYRENGVECRNLFSSIPTQEKAYESLWYREGAFPAAEDIGRRGLYIPCHQGLTDSDIELMNNLKLGKGDLVGCL